MNKNYLNLGCGKRYHKSWTNVDFIAIGDDVIAHNLINGIPFEDDAFEVVYHSHVLEHFNKTNGLAFISECYRVTKIGGIIRVAVPDLEKIIQEYQRNLERALNNELGGMDDYDWIMLELYDQVVRNESGGDMAKYMFSDTINNEAYIYERIGDEARKLRESRQNRTNTLGKNGADKKAIKIGLKAVLKDKLKNYLFKSEIKRYEDLKDSIQIGQFRLGGEIHQWMYDRYSLKRLLLKVGFTDVKICSAFESRVPNWNDFELESKNGVIHKPDSLFMEAIKTN
jgi:ubiquinone/menaquinone biosynthesis C-methylase UbiE